VLTLIGPAGAGKTRLARRLGEIHSAGKSFDGGVWFCDLTDAEDLAGVLSAVAQALDVPLTRATGAGAITHLARAIEARGRTMLILDNCEQVVEAVAEVVARITELAPACVQIATSRESLRVQGEQVHDVAPLATHAEEGQTSDAVRLFVDRAQGVRPGFAPNAEELRALERIVQRLDGLPLAIELAAARVGALSVSTIHERLEERFTLLAGSSRLLSKRQRTMRGALDWSWELLHPWERDALAQCAIFRGGFMLVAAEKVVDLSATPDAPAVIDVLQSLCEKSLIVSYDVVDLGERRYRLYESIRDYALERLHASGHQDEALENHCKYFTAAGLEWAKAAAIGDVDSRRRLMGELENLLAAHKYAVAGAPRLSGRANDAFTLCHALVEALKRRGPLELCLSLLDATLADAVARKASPNLVGAALRDRAYAKQFSPGTAEEKLADLTRAIEIARVAGDAELELQCLDTLVSHELLRGNPEAARVHAKAALARARANGPHELAHALSALASCDLAVGRLEEARATLQEAIAIARRTSDVECAHYIGRLGEVLIELGRLDEAEACVDEAIALSRPFAHRRWLTVLAGLRGTIAFERGDFARACAFYEEALASAREWGADLLEPFYRALHGAALADSGDVARATADLDHADAQLPRFANDPFLAMTTNLCRGHLDLAEAREAAARGDTDASLAHRLRAEQRIERLAGSTRVFEDLVPMRRRLERALDRMSATDSLGLVARRVQQDQDNALVVAADGAWFRAPGGKRVDIARRPNLNRVLVSLTMRRVAASGQALSLEDIMRAGWPGDKARHSSAVNRARVTLARLRKLGLGDLLVTTKDGYLLDPNVPILIAPTKD
jgi:predicted ATPase